jgi:hypothetical protein
MRRKMSYKIKGKSIDYCKVIANKGLERVPQPSFIYLDL